MIQTTMKGVEKLKGLGQGSDDLFDRVRMQRLAEYSRDVVVARIRKGIGSDGTAMPALSSKTSAVRNTAKRVVRIRTGYAAAKAKRGLQPFRDLFGTGKQGGHMLDNLLFRSASNTSARIAFTKRDARIKALANERRAPFLGFAPQDVALIKARANEMFRSAIRTTTGGFPALIRRFRKAA